MGANQPSIRDSAIPLAHVNITGDMNRKEGSMRRIYSAPCSHDVRDGGCYSDTPRTPRSSCCFNVPGITNCIEGRFRAYWEQNGGLAVFGYPITAAHATGYG